MLQFKRIFVLGAIVFILAVTATGNAYGHGCESQSCMYWPSGVLGAYSDVLSVTSLIMGMLIVSMLFFRFYYLPRKDFYVLSFRASNAKGNRSIFEGKDRRKILAALPFLAFGGLVLVASIQLWLTYGDRVFERCYDDGVGPILPECEPTTYSAIAAATSIFSLPFFAVGVFLMLFGLKRISFVTLKKELAK